MRVSSVEPPRGVDGRPASGFQRKRHRRAAYVGQRQTHGPLAVHAVNVCEPVGRPVLPYFKSEASPAPAEDRHRENPVSD